MRWYHDSIVYGVMVGTNLAGAVSGPSVGFEVAFGVPLAINVAVILGCFVHGSYLVTRRSSV